MKRPLLSIVKTLSNKQDEAPSTTFPETLTRPVSSILSLLLVATGNWALFGMFSRAIANTDVNPPNTGVYNRLQNAQLNSNQFESLVCWFYTEPDPG
ncbi:MAG: hypothetical protein AAF327_09755, partial [Cyanobacteria bacterium P01_A01_bin.37]